MPIVNSAKTVLPGFGSPSITYTLNDFTTGATAQTITALLGVPVATQPPTGSAVSTGSGPVRRGYVRVKTEALVATFLVAAIIGKDASGNQIVLYHGDVATALAGVATAYVDELFHFIVDRPLVEIDINIVPGAAVNMSMEIVAGA